MAKKKKGKRRRSYRKKAKRSGPKAKPVGLAGGAALSGFEMLTTPSGPFSSSILDKIASKDFTTAVKQVPYSVTDPMKYKYAAVGMVVTASPKIPLLNIFARPVNNGLKRLTKGKWGL